MLFKKIQSSLIEKLNKDTENKPYNIAQIMNFYEI
jgi:hypothetical protein